MPTTTYLVDGMTCEHCIRAVTVELHALGDVTGVEIGLVVGGSASVTVTSDRARSDAEVAAAVDEAGYVLVTAGPA